MKKIIILLSFGVFLTVACATKEQEPQVPKEPQVSNVNWTPCMQGILKSSGLWDKVVIEFTDKGVNITCFNFEVYCDFTTVNVTHTFVNGVLNITQQGDGGEVDCICSTDVSYTINGIFKNEVNVILINGVQVYCHNQSNCDKDVIISADEYENAPNHPISIIDMKIESNCLKIKFSASGCSGDNWIVELIDSGMIAESLPCQRMLRLSLNDIGLCDAYFENEMSFNIEDLQIQGNHSVLLNISGQSILYEY